MIISFSQLGKQGRLGNQLFQVHSTLGLAEKYNAGAVFPIWEYEQYFEQVLQHEPVMELPVVQEKFFHHYDWNLMESSDVSGYLQSEKYFGKQKLKFKKEFLDNAMGSPVFERESICIQIRRGDYVGNQNYHQLNINYYIDALLTHFPNWRESNILVLSDDLEYAKVHFECLPNVYFGSGTDIVDMAFASLCNHFIISNSSYGWWCAYLGEKPGSKIVHCGRLHAGKLSKKGNEDYYPERWIKFEKSEYKIDLKDVTFTIPIHYDHMNRKENLDLSLYMLQSSFYSNYIVCEQGGNKFAYTEAWANYLMCTYEDFHRTKMLNDMCEATTTPYIVNWDCDIILPPMQIVLARELLRDGADLVYPYDGRFARMKRTEWFPALQKSFDIGSTAGKKFKGMEPNINSVGGVAFWNKESFIDVGMENQYMISFGPEDVERHNRVRTFGYDMQRVKGVLFHLDHFVGENSSPKNKHFQHNIEEEKKVTAMSMMELSEYVNTWPWRHNYTTRYYHRISEGAVRSAKVIMDLLPFKPKSVIDIGCGVGEWWNGNIEYIGVDYRVDRNKLLIPYGSYIDCNLDREFILPPKEFDLCICLEVAEHLKPSRAEPLVEYLCLLSDYVLFSAAIPYQGGQGHVNEQWQSYWAELFLEQGFGVEPSMFKVRDELEAELWYRQNIVLYKRGENGKVYNFVLPEYYEQIVKALKT